jgi:hypothetical protein
MTNHITHDAPPSTPNLYGAPIFDSDGRVAGFILERGGLRYLDKRIDQAKHFFRRYGGYGIGDKALTDALAAGARYARFHDDARGLVYLAGLDLFRTHGARVDFGFGLQWVLALKHWTQAGAQDSEPVSAAAATEPEAQQMALFGGAA